jgi:ornithine cyclodeaminase
VLLLTAADVLALAPMPAAIDAVERAFVELSAGRATAPVRPRIEMTAPPGVLLCMPAAVPAAGALGAKLVTVFDDNPRQGKPLVHAVVVLIDPGDGAPLALLDGRLLTALRTGAASGVATRHLARPEAAVLTCFGAGALAEHQIAAVLAVRPIRRVVLCSRTPARAEALAEQLRARWPAVEIVVERDPGRAAAQADVICTATTASTPVFPAAAVRPGAHINGVGAHTAAMAEVPAELVARARVVVDQRDAARVEAGDLIQAVAAGLVDERVFATELGEVAAGTAPGRTGPDEITFFKSVGNAVQDVAVARLAVDAARRLGRGQVVAL